MRCASIGSRAEEASAIMVAHRGPGPRDSRRVGRMRYRARSAPPPLWRSSAPGREPVWQSTAPGRETMKNGFKVMDSDLHTMEPDGLWERYLDEPFKKFAPTFERRPEQSPHQPI